MYVCIHIYILIHWCIVSIPIWSDQKDGSTVKLFFYLSNQTLLVLMKHEVLVFKVFGAGLHKLIHFNSWTLPLYFTCNCCRLLEAKKFSRNPGQFEWVTRETRYHIFIGIRNLKSQVAELVQKPTTMLKILYFNGGNQFSDQGDNFSKIIH